MTENEGLLNELWGYEIIDLMVKHGVSYFCIAPGSRSTPLALAIANHPKANKFIHHDERSLGFHALGYAKASRQPVAIVVTSGTAVGNLMPAIMEAKSSNVPLLILTADRPPELRDLGANQTTDQVKVFSSFVNWEVDLPCPDEKLPKKYLSSIISYACFALCHPAAGPVHINCMFREPLHTNSKHFAFTENRHASVFSTPLSILNEDDLQTLEEIIASAKQGMIIVGSLQNQKQAQDILTLAKQIKWPVVCDIESFMRQECSDPAIIKHFELILKTGHQIEPDVILHFGDRIVSKKINTWLSALCKKHVHITEHFNRFDPSYSISNRITCNINWLCKELLKNIYVSSNELLNPLSHLSNVVSRTLEKTFSSFETIYEPYIPHMISKLSGMLPCSIFFGNSMPIRDADNLFYPEASGIEVFVNRGMSGIDGNISTAIGIALAKLRPMIAVLGDITFLHDIGSIEKLSESTIPIIIFVINNGGGGIFSFLPIVKKEKEFEEFFATAHVNRFYKISEFADVEFYSPTTTNELDDLWNDLQQQPRTCIIEILTNREENLAVHETITEIVKNSLCSSPLHSAL